MNKFSHYYLATIFLVVLGCSSPLDSEGLIGPQGAQGAQGLIGPQGAIGAQGLIGPQGAIGAQGLIGPQGAIGAQGAQGLIGNDAADFSHLFLPGFDLRDTIVHFENNGTGVIIGPNYVLALNNQIVRSLGEGRNANFLSGGDVILTLVGNNNELGLSLWKFSTDDPVAWVDIEGEEDGIDPETGEQSVAGQYVLLGTPVVVISHMHSKPVPYTSFGNVSGRWVMEPSGFLVLGVDASLSGLQRGGGVFSKEGKLLGIIDVIREDYQFDHHAIRFDDIHRAMPEMMAGRFNSSFRDDYVPIR